MMKVVAKGVRADELVFPEHPTQHHEVWWAAVGALGLRDIRPPHSLRRTTPSHDVIVGVQQLEEVRRRGRWISLKSVQRYTGCHLIGARDAVSMPLHARVVPVSRTLHATTQSSS